MDDPTMVCLRVDPPISAGSMGYSILIRGPARHQPRPRRVAAAGNLALLCGYHHTFVHQRDLTATAFGITWQT